MTRVELTALPTLNALLNSISAILLTTGYVLVRGGRIQAHRVCMLTAFFTSTVFLASGMMLAERATLAGVRQGVARDKSHAIDRSGVLPG